MPTNSPHKLPRSAGTSCMLIPVFFEGATREELLRVGVVVSGPIAKVSVSDSVSALVVLDVVVSAVVLARLVLIVWRVALIRGVSSPEREKAPDEETKGTEVERKVDCAVREPVLVIDSKGVLEGAGVCSLTEPPRGGLIWPELDSQPLGKLGDAVGDAVATQGQMSGVTCDDVSMWVPSQGMGALSTVAVTAGADSVGAGSAALLPSTLPPRATMDCQLPDLSL